MIYTNRDENTQSIVVACDCTCSSMVISQWLGENGGDVSIMFYEHAFGSHQRPIRTAIKSYLKRLWCAIVGKDYMFFDLSFIHRKTLVELKNAINLLDENLLNQ